MKGSRDYESMDFFQAGGLFFLCAAPLILGGFLIGLILDRPSEGGLAGGAVGMIVFLGVYFVGYFSQKRRPMNDDGA